MSLQLWLLLFADDLVLLSTTFNMISKLFDMVESFCNDNALNISVSKTELMVCGKKADEYVRVDKVPLG